MLRFFFTLLLIISFSAFGQTPPTTNGQQEPIHVDQAFQFSATARDNQTVIAMWNIAPGYYLYRDRFHFTTKNPEKSRLGQPLFPVGTITKSSANIGSYDVYEGDLNIPIPILKSNNKNLILIARYQGCSEKGYCYPPTTKIVPINLASNFMQPIKGISIDLAPIPIKPTTKTVSIQERIAKLLSGANLLALIFGFFGFGVLISLTPCVLPMVPILSGIIVGQKKLSHAHAFALSAAYVLGMAITYAIAGVIFGYIGGTVHAALQKPWIIT